MSIAAAVIGIGGSLLSYYLQQKNNKPKAAMALGRKAMMESATTPSGFIGKSAIYASRKALGQYGGGVQAGTLAAAQEIEDTGAFLPQHITGTLAQRQQMIQQEKETAMRRHRDDMRYVPTSARAHILGEIGREQGKGDAAFASAATEGIGQAHAQGAQYRQIGEGVRQQGRQHEWMTNVTPNLVNWDPSAFHKGVDMYDPGTGALQAGLGYLSRQGLANWTQSMFKPGEKSYETGQQGEQQAATLVKNESGTGIGEQTQMGGGLSPYFGNLFEKRGQPQKWTSNLFKSYKQPQSYGIGRLFN